MFVKASIWSSQEGQQHAPSETEKRTDFCATGTPIQQASQQRPWRDLGAATSALPPVTWESSDSLGTGRAYFKPLDLRAS